MRIRRHGCVALAFVLLPACASGKGGAATLPPLPTNPVVVTTAPLGVPTSATIVITAAPAPATSLASLPPATATSGTTIPSTITAPPPNATTTTTRPVGGAVPGSESVGTWIMQLASAPPGTPQAAIDAQLTEFADLTDGVRTLNSSDWPTAFQLQDRVIFYVGGFKSRDAVVAECSRLQLTYPDNCLARFMSAT